MNFKKQIFVLVFTLLTSFLALSDDGYRLWLRYERIEDNQLRQQYISALRGWQVPGTTATDSAISRELKKAFSGFFGETLIAQKTGDEAKLQVATGQNQIVKKHIKQKDLQALGEEGYMIRSTAGKIFVTANTEVGLLYGSFHLLRLIQTRESLTSLNITQTPDVQLRILNHWDNLDRTSERGYAGFSIWDWHRLPDYMDPRYIDYARTNASIGINGTVLTNVNANALVLSPDYLEKVKALADAFRPYGIRVYLTARFSAPMEIGGLPTADPLNEEVRQWWKEKVDEIYSYVPDFGGFLVKANSEGQPGPQNYGRTHADGANMLAEALAPHQGIVMWRAFVYSHEEPDDRAKQAYNEFKPLDGSFHENVMIQVKNGPIDFQPREPFHPLFGAMPQTPLAMEFQITQEYLGQATQLVYLAPMYEEVLDTDTYAKGEGSQVAKVIDGSLHNYSITGMAGVANTGTDRNWTGHLFGQSNWYAFGRLAWNADLPSETIAEEWINMTFSTEDEVVQPVKELMMTSWQASINYMTPLGLHHLMGTGHHYGPAPWVNNLSRADWTPVYYHKADSAGIGFDRSPSGSNATAQYFPEVSDKYGNMENVPEKYLLWFHHVSWDHQMESGRTLWEELCYRYQYGVDQVRQMQKNWSEVKDDIDDERYNHVNMLLKIQEKEAQWWKNACLLYFQQYSGREFPEYVEKPDKSLKYYKSLQFPYAPGIRPQW